MEITFDKFKNALKRISTEQPILDSSSARFIRFSISSLNDGKFSFTNKFGTKFYPDFTAIHFSKFPAQQDEMNSASIFKYGDPNSGTFYNLQPYDTMFLGGSTTHTKPLWAFYLFFWLPDSVPMTLSSIELEHITKRYSATGQQPTPHVELLEWWTEENELKLIKRIDEGLGSEYVKYKKYTF